MILHHTEGNINNMKDVIIIGGGPAGISASLYAKRAGFETAVITGGAGALKKAEKIENYYGLTPSLSGAELYERGLEQAKALGVDVILDEVTGIELLEFFTVKCANSVLEAKSVIIATGSPKNTPKISGLDGFEGKGVSYCAACDAFFYRGKRAAVLGHGAYALSESEELSPLANEVFVLTNGHEPEADFPAGTNIIKKKITTLAGENRLERVIFEDGSALETDGLFIALGSAGSTELARKLGAATEGRRIVADENGATGIPGLFAAGDCTGGMLQIAKAVHDGAAAGTAAVKFLRKK